MVIAKNQEKQYTKPLDYTAIYLQFDDMELCSSTAQDKSPTQSPSLQPLDQQEQSLNPSPCLPLEKYKDKYCLEDKSPITM